MLEGTLSYLWLPMKYQDPVCFTYNLNHVVLLVGYRLVGKDPRFPHMAPPYWIIRNSWGPDWGDGGHMRMDIQGGDGVCGINTLPGIYPIVRAVSDPCNTAARSDASGSLFNPCGSFACVVDGSSNRCNCTDPRFIEATNADGSRTCAYGDTRSQYTVLAPNIFCSDIYPIYGLTRNDFSKLNPTVSCIEPLPIGQVLNVVSKSGLAPCSVYYTTGPDDTCYSIGQYFNLNNCRGTFSCTTEFQSLNPGLSCSNGGSVQPNQAVCVERRAGAAGKAGQVIPVCSQYYLVQTAETCDAIRSVPSPPLSPLDFFRLNPGIKCNRLVPDAAGLDLHTGFEACIQVSGEYTVGICPKSKGLTASGSERCSFIQIKYFRGIRGCYKRINGYECIDKIPSGAKICLPDQTRIRQGVCTV
ncbi:unnamed protein product [Closterium sp. NIES-64]|nr:unnamed protein product [Closterium sp. NIES-64]